MLMHSNFLCISMCAYYLCGCTDIGPSDDYYLFSDALPEDKELRQQLQRRRLVRKGGREGGRERDRERDRERESICPA